MELLDLESTDKERCVWAPEYRSRDPAMSNHGTDLLTVDPRTSYEKSSPGSAVAQDSYTIVVIKTFGVQSWLKEVMFRAVELCNLPPNWDSYGSPPPAIELLGRIKRTLRETRVESVDVPDVIPASGGGIQLEWASGTRELEIEFMPGGEIGFLAVDEENDEEPAGTLGPGDFDQLRFWLEWLQG
jgi:hypothetical protein